MNDNQSEALLPCPFCGDKMRIYGSSKNIVRVTHSSENNNYQCPCFGRVWDLKDWNTRHTPTPPLPDLTQKGGDVQMKPDDSGLPTLTSPEQQRIANVLLGNVESEIRYGPVETGEQQQPSRGDKCKHGFPDYIPCPQCDEKHKGYSVVKQSSPDDLAKAIEGCKARLEAGESLFNIVVSKEHLETLLQYFESQPLDKQWLYDLQVIQSLQCKIESLEETIRAARLQSMQDNNSWNKEVKILEQSARDKDAEIEKLKAKAFGAIGALARLGVAVDEQELSKAWMDKNALIEKLVSYFERWLEKGYSSCECGTANQLAHSKGYGKNESKPQVQSKAA